MSSPVVMILAAGLGTRMHSARAKVLHEVADRPLIVWAIECARAAGAERIVAILGHQREEVKSLIDARYGEGAIEIVHQQEQNGTGHAVMCALPILANEPDDCVVVIITGDAPLLGSSRIVALAEACRDADSKLALLSTRATRPMPYGRLLRDDSGKLLEIVEESDATDAQKEIEELNAGFYAAALGELRADVAALTADNAQKELYLTDLAKRAAERGGAAVLEAPFAEVTGINDRIDLAEVDRAARLRINEDWMRGGVTIVDPSTTFIGADVGPIGTDCWIAPSTHIRGTTTIGKGVRIDTGVVLRDVHISDDVLIKPHSVLTNAIIGERARVGPFSHCRPGTRLDEDARVGNFVETKKTHLMAGAKANHHAYLGDASIGANANIGAGTITCNYDGVNKYRTTIEANAFIGSDTQLVAPVTVGRDAYVGSGTTVTKDVPRSALALSRTKQINIEGWADRFREAQKKRKNRASTKSDS